jgi:hypothetical protein
MMLSGKFSDFMNLSMKLEDDLISDLYVEVPGVVLIMRNMDPGVVGDDPLMQGEDGLVTRFDPTHLSSQARNKFIFCYI